jgi:hypothetical protein
MILKLVPMLTLMGCNSMNSEQIESTNQLVFLDWKTSVTTAIESTDFPHQFVRENLISSVNEVEESDFIRLVETIEAESDGNWESAHFFFQLKSGEVAEVFLGLVLEEIDGNACAAFYSLETHDVSFSQPICSSGGTFSNSFKKVSEQAGATLDPNQLVFLSSYGTARATHTDQTKVLPNNSVVYDEMENAFYK